MAILSRAVMGGEAGLRGGLARGEDGELGAAFGRSGVARRRARRRRDRGSGRRDWNLQGWIGIGRRGRCRSGRLRGMPESFGVAPMGVMQPRPVMTTRCMCVSPPRQLATALTPVQGGAFDGLGRLRRERLGGLLFGLQALNAVDDVAYGAEELRRSSGISIAKGSSTSKVRLILSRESISSDLEGGGGRDGRSRGCIWIWRAGRRA